MKQLDDELFYIFVSQKNQKKDVNMSKESKYFDLNLKEKKHYYEK